MGGKGGTTEGGGGVMRRRCQILFKIVIRSIRVYNYHAALDTRVSTTI